MVAKINDNITLKVNTPPGYPPYIGIEEDGKIQIILWTRQDALRLSHKLMSYAHALQREIDKEK